MGIFDKFLGNSTPTRSHTTQGGFGGLGYGLASGGYSYNPEYTPSNADVVANPNSYSNYDFSKFGAGTLGSNPNGNWFSENKDMIGGVSQGLSALAGLGNLYTGYKQYGIAKDKFDTEKKLAMADYTNKAKAYNEELGRNADVGLALAGSSLTPEQKAAYQTKVAGQRVAEHI